MAVEGDGSFSLKGVSVYLKAKDQRLSRAVQILCSEIGGKTGELVPFRVGAEKGHCIVVCAGDDPECESCTLEVTEDRITVESGGIGAFSRSVSWSATGMFPYAASSTSPIFLSADSIRI